MKNHIRHFSSKTKMINRIHYEFCQYIEFFSTSYEKIVIFIFMTIRVDLY